MNYPFITFILLFIYVVSLAYITVLCVSQFYLLYKYWFRKENPILELQSDFIPIVTIQLPVYNEKYVIERLIDYVAKIEYPLDKLHIQILDDSTDETTKLAQNKVDFYRKKGIDIELVRRKDRVGYKAGALEYATPLAKGEFIAIFDADFLPHKDFLKKTIPYLRNEKIGVVQTRWGHINKNYSLLTQLQAFQLDIHFSIEQTGRETSDLFLQFNGTGGVWRKKTIIEAGGWQPDTLTEDLDLSYRSQLLGYKIKFLENVESPAELPPDMHSLKSQQFRWMKGGAETFLKLFKKLKQSDLPFRKKLGGYIHLSASSTFLFLLIAGIVSVPLVFLADGFIFPLRFLSIFLTGMLSIVIIYFYGTVLVKFQKGSFLGKNYHFFTRFPLFLSFSMGMSLHNSRAIIEGYRGKKSAFIRTPKFNLGSKLNSFSNSKYFEQEISFWTWMELVLSLIFLSTFAYELMYHKYFFVGFHLLYGIGFGAIFLYTIRHK